jgi:hypothetical protein
LPAAPEVAADPAVFHYTTPKNGVQGPFSLAELASFREALVRLQRWDTFRVWRTGQTEAHAVLASSLLPP